ncbi:hypothetical protein CEUSTIGMA_g4801.t1 [Chlamydomonas eustigma]|uniref:Photosystem II reaction center Psb28 protein n=1 Tax=Chlamydomonas eustigma TaxID=1157962 RepID=A0A250X2S8_9CHLO|nr:hypothetical protein CEUSTIGMA_g4801.t1 [Chlamydomonas eustigma]|eukprot:GAX77355.1 hypothetical protein CEUSTIGMA_g4801.t1 [Chlamydomonas eustigma]
MQALSQHSKKCFVPSTKGPLVSPCAPSIRHVNPRFRSNVSCEAASLQFIKGIEESTIPEVRLSRSRTGGSGSALFVFDNPSIFQASGQMGEITGLFLDDDEGTLTTTDVKAKFLNGKPQFIEARYMMRSQFEWDRFMRFMDRYAEAKGLGFEKGSKVSS